MVQLYRIPNTLKEKLLNVPSKVIKRYGAVSNETAMAMVKGLKKKVKVKS